MTRSPFLLALFNPVNLSMLALTVAAGLCSAWWLAPIGLLLWIVMVLVIARDPGLQMTFTRQNRQPLAQRYQIRFDRIERVRFSIFNAQAQSTPTLRKAIEPVSDAFDNLVEHAYLLSVRMSALHNNFYIQKISNNFEADIAAMQKNIAETSNPDSKREFESTLKSLSAQQAQLKETETLLSRFEAQLTGTISAAESVLTGVVGLQGRGTKLVSEKVPALLRTVQTEQDELDLFDKELEKF
jgi:hypothetical protein